VGLMSQKEALQSVLISVGGAKWNFKHPIESPVICPLFDAKCATYNCISLSGRETSLDSVEKS
jgi:hypothetical protein